MRTQLAFERAQVAAGAELTAVFVEHAEVHEHMRRQHVELHVVALDVQAGSVAHPLEHCVGERACAPLFGLQQLGRHAPRRLGQRYQARARALVQGFDECLDLVLEHAGHQPFAALFVHLVQRKQRHIDGDAVSGIAGFVKVGGQTIDAAHAQRLGKGLRGDAGGFMAHQLFTREQQQLRLLFDFVLVPMLAAGAGADVGRQLLVVKGVDQLFVHQHVLPARLVLEVLHLRNQLEVGRQKGQLAVPVAGHQRFTNENFTRTDRVHPAEVDAPAVVNHQAIQRGALQRSDLRGFLFPVRVQQLLL